MRRTWLALAPLAFAAPAAAGPAPAPILGGTTATVGQYPSTVAIEVGGGLCTGTLITPDWVLTAAHCVSTQVVGGTQSSITSSVRVHFNTVNIRTSAGMVVTAQETIPDPGFDLNNLGSHDSGLIHLTTPVTTIAPTPINLVAARAPVGVTVTMVGFGATAVGGGGSVGVEYVVQQTSVSCSGGVGSDANLLCFSQVSGKGKCEGDSGGPSFAMIDGKQVEVGITSFGDQNCAQFGADTRVDAEAAFLVQHVPALQCEADGACTAACGQNGLPVDPDCPVCDKDSDCPSGHFCHANQCLIDPGDPMGVGSTCTDGSQCESGTCSNGPGGDTLCTIPCGTGNGDSCPSDFQCLNSAGGGGQCWPKAGCCDAGNHGAPTMLGGIAVIGLFLRRSTRRKAPRSR